MRTTPSDATAMTSPVRHLLDRLRALRRRARGRALLARLASGHYTIELTPRGQLKPLARRTLELLQRFGEDSAAG